MENRTVKSIIDVNVDNMSKLSAVSSIVTRLETIENKVFNVALLCAYSLGRTIPSYTDIKGVKHEKTHLEDCYKKQSELINKIGRSKQTISRWIVAMDLLLDNAKYFELFASGKIPFSYDKIILIFQNYDKLESYITDLGFEKLFKNSIAILESLIESDDTESDDTESDDTESDDTESDDTESDDTESVDFVINGTMYRTTVKNLKAFLNTCEVV